MILIWQIIFIILAIACFGSFVWAVKKHFVSAGEMPAGMRVISAASLVSFLLQIFAVVRLEQISLPFAVAGILLYAASFRLFWQTIAATRRQRLTLAFADDSPQHLQTAGPYRLVRHPFYLSYLLFWTAGLIATLEWFLLLTVAAMLALYFRAACLEEAKFAASLLSESYLEYRTQTGMFFPKIKLRRYGKKLNFTAENEETI